MRRRRSKSDFTIDLRVWSDAVAPERIVRDLHLSDPDGAKLLRRQSGSPQQHYLHWTLVKAGDRETERLDLSQIARLLFPRKTAIKNLIEHEVEIMLHIALTADTERSYFVSLGNLAALEAIGIKIVITAY